MSASSLAAMLPRLGLQHYKGETRDQQPHGQGEYLLVDGTIYSGQFHEGLFHGNGSMKFANGDRFDGTWSLGQLTSGALTFADGLSCPPCIPTSQPNSIVNPATQSTVAPTANPIISQWKYCTDADRRFWTEHLNGPEFNPIGQARLTNHESQDLLPFGCYDVGDGYLHISETAVSLSAVYDFVSSHRIRNTDEAEIAWARRQCRVGDDPEVLHRDGTAPYMSRPTTSKVTGASRPRTAVAR